MRTTTHKTPSRVLGCLLCAIGVAAFAQPHEVELKLQCRASVSAVELRVTLRNIGGTDTAIVLGTSVGNGQTYVADSLELDVKRDNGGVIEIFRPTVAHIFGRIDPWIVTLPAASEFTFARPLGSYFSSAGEPLTIGRNGIDVRLRLIRRTEARFGGELVGADLVKVHVGELQTEWLRVPDACGVG